MYDSLIYSLGHDIIATYSDYTRLTHSSKHTNRKIKQNGGTVDYI